MARGSHVLGAPTSVSRDGAVVTFLTMSARFQGNADARVATSGGARRQRLELRRHTLESRKARKANTRRKILIGAVVLAKIERAEFTHAQQRKWLDESLTRTDNRALSDIVPGYSAASSPRQTKRRRYFVVANAGGGPRCAAAERIGRHCIIEHIRSRRIQNSRQVDCRPSTQPAADARARVLSLDGYQ